MLLFYYAASLTLQTFNSSSPQIPPPSLPPLSHTHTAPTDFVDSMDTKNYITVSLPKPMGIVFEENDSSYGGIFALEISDGSSAAKDGTIKPGDQLVAVGEKKVSGLQFEDALGAIIESESDKTKLVFFRGKAEFLYGVAGASQEWLDEFVSGGKKVEA